jgi:hypothetical protein
MVIDSLIHPLISTAFCAQAAKRGQEPHETPKEVSEPQGKSSAEAQNGRQDISPEFVGPLLSP